MSFMHANYPPINWQENLVKLAKSANQNQQPSTLSDQRRIQAQTCSWTQR